MSKDNSKLLIDEHPLQVLPTLACKVGLNSAIVLQQVHYWLVIAKKAKDDRKYIDGRWWVYNSYEEWKENFPWWSLPTIKRAILRLEKFNLLISKEMRARDWDHTKWYTVNYDLLDELTDSIKVIPSEDSDLDNPEAQDESLLNRNTETTTETTEIVKPDAQVFQALEKLMGALNTSVARYVDAWLEKHSLDWILKAINEANDRGARSEKYVDKILIGWEANGYPKTRNEQVIAAKNGKGKSNGNSKPNPEQDYTPDDYRIANEIRAQRGLPPISVS
jgi:DnaD/phage-associated family protein